MKRLIYVTIFLLIGIWFTSCRSVKYVPLETVRTNTEYRDHYLRDSIHVHDSIFMFMKGDTVFRDRWHTEYKNKFVSDTTYINKTDTIRIPYPIEKRLSRWDSIKLELGGWAFGAVVVLILTIAGRFVYRFRKGMPE